MRIRPSLIALAAAFAGAAPVANACSIVLTKASEPNARKRADVIITVDAESEAYVPVPGPGTLRVGIATGRVVEVHKGPATFKDSVTVYRVVDGEDAMLCPALRSTRPGKRYRLYLNWADDGGPPVITFRDPYFD